MVDKLLFELFGNSVRFEEIIDYDKESNSYISSLEFGSDHYYDYKNIEYSGINSNLICYELDLISGDLHMKTIEEYGEYEILYRVMKYIDNDEIFLRFVDVKEK
jgi:hypothetical protein